MKYKFILQYSIMQYNGQASLHLDLQGWNIDPPGVLILQILGTKYTDQCFGVCCNLVFPYEFIFCSVSEVKYIENTHKDLLIKGHLQG